MRVLAENIINPRNIIVNSIKKTRNTVFLGAIFVFLIILPLIVRNYSLEGFIDNMTYYPFTEEVIADMPNFWFEDDVDGGKILKADGEYFYATKEVFFVLDQDSTKEPEYYLNDIEEIQYEKGAKYYIYTKNMMYSNDPVFNVFISFNTREAEYNDFPSDWLKIDTRAYSEDSLLKADSLASAYKNGYYNIIKSNKVMFVTYNTIYLMTLVFASLFYTGFILALSVLFINMFIRFNQYNYNLLQAINISKYKLILNSMSLGVVISCLLGLLMPATLNIFTSILIITFVTMIYMNQVVKRIKIDLRKARGKRNEL